MSANQSRNPKPSKRKRSKRSSPTASIATADRILDVSQNLFAQRGYERTTLREIAAEVGIQNPSLYKHFESKAAIYGAVLDRAVRPLLDDFWDTEQEIEKVVAHLAARPTVCQLLLRETLGPFLHRHLAPLAWLIPDDIIVARHTLSGI